MESLGSLRMVQSMIKLSTHLVSLMFMDARD